MAQPFTNEEIEASKKARMDAKVKMGCALDLIESVDSSGSLTGIELDALRLARNHLQRAKKSIEGSQ